MHRARWTADDNRNSLFLCLCVSLCLSATLCLSLVSLRPSVVFLVSPRRFVSVTLSPRLSSPAGHRCCRLPACQSRPQSVSVTSALRLIIIHMLHTNILCDIFQVGGFSIRWPRHQLITQTRIPSWQLTQMRIPCMRIAAARMATRSRNAGSMFTRWCSPSWVPSVRSEYGRRRPHPNTH